MPEKHRGHLRMAGRFVREHRDELRYVHGIGWHYWDGYRWCLDDQRADIRAAIATTKNALNDLAKLDGDARDELYATSARRKVRPASKA